MDDFLTTIEENFIRCTYCNDTKIVPAIEPHPCPRCNLEEYKLWKDDQENQDQELPMS